MSFDLVSKLISYGLPFLFAFGVGLFALGKGFQIQTPSGLRFRTRRFVLTCLVLLGLSVALQAWPAGKALQSQLDLVALSEQDAAMMRDSIFDVQHLQSLAFPDLLPPKKTKCLVDAFAALVETQWKANHHILSCEIDPKLCADATNELRTNALAALSFRPTVKTSLALLDLFVLVDRKTFDAVRLQIPSIFGLSPFEGGPSVPPDAEAAKAMNAAIANCGEGQPPAWIDRTQPILQEKAHYIWNEALPAPSATPNTFLDGSKMQAMESDLRNEAKTLGRITKFLALVMAFTAAFVFFLTRKTGHTFLEKAPHFARASQALLSFFLIAALCFLAPHALIAHLPITFAPTQPFMGETISKLTLTQINLQTELMTHLKDDEKRLSSCLLRIGEYETKKRYASCETKNAPCPTPPTLMSKEDLLSRLKSTDLSADENVRKACEGVPLERLEPKAETMEPSTPN